jgi:folate-dependent phosphoribosylglycinamide formyltransferase PurN
LLLGSTVLSAFVVEAALPEVVGHVPSVQPAFPGRMQSPIVAETARHDIKLSVQFDRKLVDIRNAYNLHTGLLPHYGGVDILHHTPENGDREQGLTFHAMSDRFDGGPIISTITCPVLPSDGIIELYERMLAVAPHFVRSSLALLGLVDVAQINGVVPKLYRHSDVKNLGRYARDGNALSGFLRDRGLLA